jgi:purine-binding chemotaxis protein CheW
MAEGQVIGVEEQLVVFDLADEVYAMEIGRVQEIIRITPITRLPKAPEFVEGVINLRGKVIPVVDLKKRFGLRQTESTTATRIVVVDIGDQTIGAIVDGVSEVLQIAASEIEPPSPVVMTVHSDYIRGIARLEQRLVILLNLDKVLDLGEKRQLAEVA